MTAVLEEIRRLEAAERRGEISATEMRMAKANLMDAIEDANGPTPPQTSRNPKLPQNALWHILLFCFVFAGFCTALATLLFGDLTLALTLTVTLLAAFTVHAFRTLDD